MSLSNEEILALIKGNKQLRAEILKKDDSIIDDIYKYIENSNSSSKDKLEVFIKQNSDFINNVIKTITPQQPQLPQLPKATPVPQPPKVTPAPPSPVSPIPSPQEIYRIGGEVYEIDPNPMAFKEFIDHTQTQRWIFRGLSVLEKINDEGKKVWVLFFY